MGDYGVTRKTASPPPSLSKHPLTDYLEGLLFGKVFIPPVQFQRLNVCHSCMQFMMVQNLTRVLLFLLICHLSVFTRGKKIHLLLLCLIDGLHKHGILSFARF